MGRPSMNRSHFRRPFKLERLPDYLRETVDWIIGKYLLK
uniref:IS5/IS1182 family transposase n=1 Tax=Heterorhabditis bacteriophora TaxID=37862 RepID=A0A1I7WLF4_HETBA